MQLVKNKKTLIEIFDDRLEGTNAFIKQFDFSFYLNRNLLGSTFFRHFYFKDFWKADSGALAALHVIAALGTSKGSLSKLLKPYQRYFSSGEINSKVKDAQKSMGIIEQKYAEQADVSIDHLDGLTVNGDTWWFNLRPSNTEPLLRLNVEAKTLARMEKITDEVLATVRK